MRCSVSPEGQAALKSPTSSTVIALTHLARGRSRCTEPRRVAPPTAPSSLAAAAARECLLAPGKEERCSFKKRVLDSSLSNGGCAALLLLLLLLLLSLVPRPSPPILSPSRPFACFGGARDACYQGWDARGSRMKEQNRIDRIDKENR